MHYLQTFPSEGQLPERGAARRGVVGEVGGATKHFASEVLSR